MNQRLNPAKTGLAVGKLFAGIHLVWAILVALGWAQAVVDWSAWAHMVADSPVVAPFDVAAALSVIVVAGLVGYVIGYAFAKISNLLHR